LHFKQQWAGMKNVLWMSTAAAFMVCSGTVANSAEIDAISGRYVYTSYKATLRNGASLNLQQLGAKSATLEILPNMVLRMEMRMLNGTSTITKARILELKTSGSRGYFVAHWPDMKFPVKEEFTVIPNGLRYIIHFTDPSDAMRYGGKEEATLKRADER
jgi:hypothetical protein